MSTSKEVSKAAIIKVIEVSINDWMFRLDSIKKDKEGRWLFITQKGKTMIDQWLEKTGLTRGYLLRGIRKGDHLTEQLHPGQVNKALKRMGRATWGCPKQPSSTSAGTPSVSGPPRTSVLRETAWHRSWPRAAGSRRTLWCATWSTPLSSYERQPRK